MFVSTRMYSLSGTFISLFFGAELLLAGNWSGGGGEILEQAHNPWFLDTGSSPFTYCVTSDADFAVPLPELERLVEASLRWWNIQFGNAHYPTNEFSFGVRKFNVQVVVNTSRYMKEDCKESTELRFQFGTVTAAQAAEFENLKIDLTRYVALSIRTDYDEKILRGKGFIYISPDRGARAFRGQDVMENAWTEHDEPHYDRLRSVVTHELGHIFGLSHSPNSDHIMGARFSETVVSKSRIDTMYPLGDAVFFPDMTHRMTDDCDETGKENNLRRFFEIPAHLRCYRLRVNLNQFFVEAAENENQEPWQKIGSAKFLDGGQRRHQQLVSLWVPQGQEVFPNLPSYIKLLLGPASSEVQNSAEFKFTNSGKTKPIFIQASPRFFQIGGVLDGKLVPDLLPETEYGRMLSGWSSK